MLIDGCLYIYSELDLESPARGKSNDDYEDKYDDQDEDQYDDQYEDQ